MLAYAFPARTAHFEIICIIVICAPINYINTCAKLPTVDSLFLLAVPVNKSLLRACAAILPDCHAKTEQLPALLIVILTP